MQGSRDTSMHDAEHTAHTHTHKNTHTYTYMHITCQMPPRPKGVIMVIARRSGLGRPFKARHGFASLCVFTPWVCVCVCVCKGLLFGVSGNMSDEALWQMLTIRLASWHIETLPVVRSQEIELSECKERVYMWSMCNTERERAKLRHRVRCFGWFPTVISSTELFVLPTSIRSGNVSSGSKQVCTEGKTVQRK